MQIVSCAVFVCSSRQGVTIARGWLGWLLTASAWYPVGTVALVYGVIFMVVAKLYEIVRSGCFEWLDKVWACLCFVSAYPRVSFCC